MKKILTALGLPLLAIAFAFPAAAQTPSDTSSTTSASMAMPAAMTTMSAGLKLGASGQSVVVLQQFLISKGYSIPAGATGYFGTQTAAALDAYYAGGTGDSMNGSVPTTDTKAADLRAAMHDLLEEHVSSSLNVLRAISDDNQDAEDGALAEQDANAVSLSAAIGSVYGADAESAFLKIFRAHIVDSNAYTQALKDGDMTDQKQALADLDSQLQQISSLLSGANPNIDNATLLSALRQHEDLVNQASEAYNDGDFDKSYSIETQALTQIAGGADYLSGAIVKQYPDKF